LHGDYNEEEVATKATFYTPIPGGVGPVNVAMLLSNLIKASENN
jgi:methylenetetrahydrofolate dehydrogenase (NADP+)/methenyltetrahydrofolate cyclohydrolase